MTLRAFGLCLTVAASGGAAAGRQIPPPISVGGAYETAVSLLWDSCGDAVVRPALTVVAHTPGADTLTLTHAGNAYAGAIRSDGAFTTTPRTLRGGGAAFTLTIAGKFSRTGFDATVTVAVERASPSSRCRYLVHWVGTKHGEPNVVPGGKP